MFESFETTINSKLFWITLVIISLYIYVKYIVFGYWRRKGIPHEKPKLIYGNFLPFFQGKISLGETVLRNYEKFCKHPYHGMYVLYKPVLLINDPELIRCVLIKESQNFIDRSYGVDEKLNPLAAHLFFLNGEKWKKLRTKLTPTFTSGKLKIMFPLMKIIGDELATVVDNELKISNEIEVKDIITRYTTDTIACLVFGLEPDSLKNPNSEFRKHGRLLFHGGPFKSILLFFFPNVVRLLRKRLVNEKLDKFFTSTLIDTIKYRKKEKIVRNDFLKLLMELIDMEEIQDNGETENLNVTDKSDKITMMEACAQAFAFFLAGFETSSSTVTYCLYELALNPDVQEKLQQEIDEFQAKPEGLTYSNVFNEMKYLDMVFNETVRKHPSVPFLTRICEKEWIIPGSDYTIPEGMMVLIDVSGIQRNPEFYPEPDKFNPERFTKENLDSRSPYTFLGFGDGPRNCIGNRFGAMQSKIALISLLSKFKFSLCKKSPFPIQYSVKTFAQMPSDSVFLKIERR